VPQITWPPLPRTGVVLFGPNLRKVNDHQLMTAALEQAQKALAAGEVPIGAVVAVDGEIIGTGHNERQASNDPTAHAEVLALRQAAQHQGDWRLADAILVVTLEPCPMCAGAAWASRIGRVVFGAANMEAGSLGSLLHVGADPRLNHEFPVTGGVQAEACTALLDTFFDQLRRP